MIYAYQGSARANFRPVTKDTRDSTRPGIAKQWPTLLMIKLGRITMHRFSEALELDMGRGEVLLQIAPLPHATQFMLLPGFLRGGTHVLMKKFEPEEVLRAVGTAP